MAAAQSFAPRRPPRTGRRQTERIADVDDDAENGHVAEGDLGSLPSAPPPTGCRLSDLDIVGAQRREKLLVALFVFTDELAESLVGGGRTGAGEAADMRCKIRVRGGRLEPCLGPGPTVLPAEPRRRGSFARERNSRRQRGKLGGAPLLSLRTKRRARSTASASRAAISACSNVAGNLVIVAPSSACAS